MRFAWVFTVALLLFGLASVFSGVWMEHSGMVVADPYSYVSYARLLSEGRFHLDGGVAQATRAFSDGAVRVLGPVWNTSVLPDGRTVFGIAPGFPLWLALMLKLGGTWLCLHANILLLGLVMALIVLCFWEGFDRSLAGLAAGAVACLLLPRTAPATFLQFTYPWREALFYTCLVGAAYALIRFSKSGRLVWIGLLSFFLGYAFAIKESNLLYTPVYGLVLLILPAFRRYRPKWKVFAVGLLFAVIGASPLLVQNALTTGNPLVSLQTLRETSEFSVNSAGHGLSLGNVSWVVKKYVAIYSLLPLFDWKFLAVALAGIAWTLKRPVGWIFLGVGLLHFGFYSMFGNAEYRHMFLAHIPYSVFLGAGIVLTIDRLAALCGKYAEKLRWLCMIPLVALVCLPVNGMLKPDKHYEMTYRQAGALTREVTALLPKRSILLTNRILRDVLGSYASDMEVIRLHDLVSVDPEKDMGRVLDWFHGQGVSLYFLDNPDLDPKHYGLVDWERIDWNQLKGRCNLRAVRTFDKTEYGYRQLTLNKSLTLYEIAPWTTNECSADLAVPADGAAFLSVDPQPQAIGAKALLDGKTVYAGAGPYLPVHRKLPPSEKVPFTVRGGSNNVPDRVDAALIGWADTITVPLGADAVSADDGWLVESSTPQPDAGWRVADPSLTLRVPIRQRRDLFTTIGLNIDDLDPVLPRDPLPFQVFVKCGEGFIAPVSLVDGAVWFPLLVPESGKDFAGYRDVELFTVPPRRLRLFRMKADSGFRSLEITPRGDSRGMVLTGCLAPDAIGAGMHPWSVWIDGTKAASGMCLSDPSSPSNRCRIVIPPEEKAKTRTVEIKGAGLIRPRWIETGSKLEVAPGTESDAFMQGGFYATEGKGAPFCWTSGRAVVEVPLTPGSKQYQLVLNVENGHPVMQRSASVTFQGLTQKIILPAQPMKVLLEFQAGDTETPSMAEVALEVETWNPARQSGVQDSRDLGFKFYGLEWYPAL